VTATAEHAVQHAAEVRCLASVLHFKVIDGDRIEVKCSHRLCTQGGMAVLHRFSFDGELLETLTFKDPTVRGRRAPRTSRKEDP
jgi:hypothetical protein